MNNKPKTALRFGTQNKPTTTFRLQIKTDVQAGNTPVAVVKVDGQLPRHVPDYMAADYCRNYYGGLLQNGICLTGG
ncbi:MAG: hypothetical protein AAF614_32415 [Chloroflexota bacterium]